MYSAEQIRSIEIKKSTFGGYNMDEVDDILDEAADSIELLQKSLDEVTAKAALLTQKLDSYSTSESSINSALINAQRLADQTVKEASETAGHTLSDANMKAEIIVKEAEEKAASVLSKAEEEANAIINDAISKTECMIAAAHDSVARQQLLFDKLRVENRDLKEELIKQYKKQLSFVEQLPDEVPFDSERAAEAMAFAYDNVPDYDAMAASVPHGAKVQDSVYKQPDADNDIGEENDYAKILSDAIADSNAQTDEDSEPLFVVNIDESEL